MSLDVQFSSSGIDEYCQGKAWLPRFPLASFLLYLFFQHATDSEYFGFLGNFNLIIHEAGHWIFFPFGETLGILGGTILQSLVPAAFLLVFVFQREYLGVSFCLGWLADNLFGVATYVADARAMVLPLLGGDSSGHDWHNLLQSWGLSQYDLAIGMIFRLLAGLGMTIAVALAFWLLWRMYKLQKVR